MDSEPDGIEATSNDDLDRLLSAALGAAKVRLAEVSDFEPFVLIVGADSRVLAAEWDTSSLGKHPEIEELLESAVAQLRSIRSTINAAAIVVNTRISRPRTDAVEVRIEHSAGRSTLMLLPYRRAKFGARVEFGELQAFAKPTEVWT